MGIDFLINKSDIRQTRFLERKESGDLADGEILVAVDEVAFTANNVTYAAVGEYLKYWKFFPTNEEGWGRLPVWGYGDVVASAHEAIGLGERLYGYWPLGTHLRITAVNVTPNAFLDGAPHRQSLNPIYNQYIRIVPQGGFAPQGEHLNALLRPMFTTSFLVDDFLHDNDFFGADVLLLSSASSKTGYGTAFMHHRERESRRPYQIIGLTSAGNHAFVEGLGCYDRVLSYDEVTSLGTDQKVVYIDYSGNGRLRHTIHTHFGSQLTYDCAIGLTDWQMQGSNQDLPGVPAKMFFAPAQIQKRRREWGAQPLQQRINEAFGSFLIFAKAYIEVEVVKGREGMTAVYDQMVQGTAEPGRGFIFAINRLAQS